MHQNEMESVITPELVRELRERAGRGATVRELAYLIQDWAGCGRDAVVPVLAGFVHAFKLPLRTVLPIREWIGSQNDEEINALILPEIEGTRAQWSDPVVVPK